MKITLQAAVTAGVIAAVDFEYTRRDPYALVFTVRSADGQAVPWVAGRDLFGEGLLRAVGEGDVRIAPHGREVHVTITGPHDGRTLTLAFARQQLVDMLRESYTLVPRGHEREHLDWSDTARVFPGFTA
ncbi:SsgA family sporulation/cell division regulator [Amycolatopsis sp. NPDC001319]|uniref:SsgA family sporulation/cell division regulator n=1 Tax=unclassified Amycolatopsis TaxID=2618356 RepID=UPI0036772564